MGRIGKIRGEEDGRRKTPASATNGPRKRLDLTGISQSQRGAAWRGIKKAGKRARIPEGVGWTGRTPPPITSGPY